MRKPRLWRWGQNLLIEKQHRLVIGGGIGCFLLLSLLAMAGDRGFFEVYQFNRHLQHVEGRIQALEVENERLRMQVTGLRSDPYQMEKLAMKTWAWYADELSSKLLMDVRASAMERSSA
jgi:hypothetical protein